MKKFISKKHLSILLSVFLSFQAAVPFTNVQAAEKQNVPITTSMTDASSILKNCAITITKDGQKRTEPFRETETSTEVQVKLDTNVKSCHMIVYAYAGNTSFDPDSEKNIRLYDAEVKDGQTVTCQFKSHELPLKPGYKVVACLNVPIDTATDYYRILASDPIEIVDKNGQGFKDYDYPDASIDEKTLNAGATTLHVSLKGDERIFQAAKEGKTAINCAIAQYPANEDFDFEGKNQSTLNSIMRITEPFTAKEITLSEPLKEGYRVRAVVYWEQNVDLFLPKGNDYEAVFHRPDDSVLIGKDSSVQPTTKPTVAFVGDIKENTKNLSLNLTGEVPDGTKILVKMFDKGTTSFTNMGGTFVGISNNVKPGNIDITVSENLVAGKKLVAFLLTEEPKVLVQTDPYVIQTNATAPTTPTVKILGAVKENDTAFTVKLSGEIPKDSIMFIKSYKPNEGIVQQGGTFVANKSNLTVGEINIPMPQDKEKAGIKAGNKLVAFILHDGKLITQTEPITIQVSGDAVRPNTVEIATSTITADRTDVWVIANFDPKKAATLKLYTFQGANFVKEQATEIYTKSITPKENSQRIEFGTGKLKAGHRLIAVLQVGAEELQSAVKVIQAAPVPQETGIQILDKEITKGDTKLTAAITLDTKSSPATYKLYQFAGETVDLAHDQVLSTNTIYKSTPKQTVGGLNGKLVVGEKLQLVMTAQGKTYYSNVVPVSPSPDWGTPSAAFTTNAVFSDAKTIPVFVQYDDKYFTLGDDFYCDVSIYQFPAKFTDDEFEGNEMWEQSYVQHIGQVNSRQGAETRGNIEVPLRKGVKLNPGDKVIIKLRLPHTEWDEEEVDYVSLSIPVLKPGQTVPEEKVLLYNLGDETERGHRVRKILDNLKIPYITIEEKSLYETIGYLAGFEGYESVGKEYTGEPHTTEFMLMSSLSENTLDKFLLAMQEDGLKIKNKSIVTAYNKEMSLLELIEDIKNEDQTFHALIALNNMVEKAKDLKEKEYGAHKDWNALQQAIKEGDDLLKTFEPPLEDLKAAQQKLENLYISLTGQKKLLGFPVITIVKNDDGTYRMTAQIKDAEPGAVYHYKWRTGETTETIDHIAADKLIGMSITITADNHFGEETAQLAVPDVPSATVTATQTEVQMQWNSAVVTDNRPLPEKYQIFVYLDDQMIKQKECNAKEAVSIIEGLTPDQTYCIKVAAISPVGRSTLATFTAKTLPLADGTVITGGTAQTEGTGENKVVKNEIVGNISTSHAIRVNVKDALTSDGITAKKAEVTIHKTAAKAIADAAESNKPNAIILETDQATVTLPKEAVRKIGHAGRNTDVKITIEDSSAQYETGVINTTKKAYTVSVQAGNQNVLPANEKNNGVITIEVNKIPVSAPDKLYAYYVTKDRTGIHYLEDLSNTVAMSGTNKMIVKINHLSTILFTTTKQTVEINDITLLGNITPEKGGVPAGKTALTAENGYTIESLTWNPVDNPFKANTVYTATLVLKTMDGYKFADSVNVTNAVTGAANTGKVLSDNLMITAKFAATSNESSGNSSHGSSHSSNKKPSIYVDTTGSSKTGKVEISNKNAKPGDKVTITITPDKGYELDKIIIKDRDGNKIDFTKEKDGTYIFTVPKSGKVDITPIFAKVKEQNEESKKEPVELHTITDKPFSDVKATDWFAKQVAYVVSHSLMSGVDNNKFAPNYHMTRAMVWQVLAKLHGVHTAGGAKWYTKSMEWAVANKITDGSNVNGNVTREQLVTMMYRYAKANGLDISTKGNIEKFSDAKNVSPYAKEAMQWAVGSGFIHGMDGKLNPQGNATRAQVATILMYFHQSL